MPPKATWRTDNEASNCGLCGESFSVFRRRHHCRNCGGVFCSNCCNTKRKDIAGYIGIAVLVCIKCVRTTDSSPKVAVKDGQVVVFPPKARRRRVVVVGGPSSGKSALIERYLTDSFTPSQQFGAVVNSMNSMISDSTKYSDGSPSGQIKQGDLCFYKHVGCKGYEYIFSLVEVSPYEVPQDSHNSGPSVAGVGVGNGGSNINSDEGGGPSSLTLDSIPRGGGAFPWNITTNSCVYYDESEFYGGGALPATREQSKVFDSTVASATKFDIGDLGRVLGGKHTSENYSADEKLWMCFGGFTGVDPLTGTVVNGGNPHAFLNPWNQVAQRGGLSVSMATAAPPADPATANRTILRDPPVESRQGHPTLQEINPSCGLKPDHLVSANAVLLVFSLGDASTFEMLKNVYYSLVAIGNVLQPSQPTLQDVCNNGFLQPSMLPPISASVAPNPSAARLPFNDNISVSVKKTRLAARSVSSSNDDEETGSQWERGSDEVESAFSSRYDDEGTIPMPTPQDDSEAGVGGDRRPRSAPNLKSGGFGDNNALFILVGTKAEIVVSEREVSTEEATQTAATWGIPYVEVSSKEPHYFEAPRFLAQIAAGKGGTSTPPPTAAGSNSNAATGQQVNRNNALTTDTSSSLHQRKHLSHKAERTKVQSERRRMGRATSQSNPNARNDRSAEGDDVSESEASTSFLQSDDGSHNIANKAGRVVEEAYVYATYPVDPAVTQSANVQLANGLDNIVEKTASVTSLLPQGRITVDALFDCVTSQIAHADGI